MTQITETVRLVPVEIVEPNPYQMRDSEDPEHITKLADSIARDGLLQYPLGRPGNRGDRVTLAFGHSRLAAYKLLKDRAGRGEVIEGGDLTDLAKYNEMPVIVRDLTDEQMFVYGTQENIARKSLNPVEEGRLMLIYREKFGKTSAQIGLLFGMSESAVRNKMRLVDLPETAIAGLAEGKITENAARRLLSLQDVVKPEVISTLATDIAEKEYIRPEHVDSHIVYAILQQKEAIKLYAPYEAKNNLAMDLFPLDWTPAEALPFPDLKQIRRFVFSGQNGFDSTSPEAAKAIESLTHPPACKKCPFFVSLANQGICGRKVCFERKRDAWVMQELARVSAETGVAIYDPEQDGKVFEDVDWNNKTEFEKLWNEKSPDLRLNGVVIKYGLHKLTNSKCAELISVSKTSINRKIKEKSGKAFADERERLLEESRQLARRNEEIATQLLDIASPEFGRFLFGGYNLGTLRVLFRISHENTEVEKTAEEIIIQLGRKVIGSSVPWHLRRDRPAAVTEFLIGIAAEMGMKLTLDLKTIVQELEEGVPA